MKIINIARDFSDEPGLRHCSISDHSGEQFYHQILNNAFAEVYRNNGKLTVDLDGTAGYASSFLDEAFGNLVYDFSLNVVKDGVEIVSNQEPHWKNMLLEESFQQWEKRRKRGERPVVTRQHEAWYRLVNNILEHKVWETPHA